MRSVAFIALMVPVLACRIWTSAVAAETPVPRPSKFSLTEVDRSYWAFQPLRRVGHLVNDSRTHASRHPVDALVEKSLRARSIRPNPMASPRSLIRRAAFDLTGLPPRPDDVEAFSRNPDDAVWGRYIDSLLASPEYGERWARHWLDLVRYAESNGYERDGPKPNAWRYRDWVIAAFNRDKPYDAFIREQLSGDLMADEWEAAERAGVAGEFPRSGSPQWRDAIIATGFYRLHVWDDEPDNTEAADYDELDDILSTMGTAFMGLTIGCARCHDHKYDPFSQSDYYSFLAFFRGIEGYGLPHKGGGGRGTGRILRSLSDWKARAEWAGTRSNQLAALEKQMAETADPERKKELSAQARTLRDSKMPGAEALAIGDAAGLPKPTFVLQRGEPDSPRQRVEPAVPEVLRQKVHPSILSDTPVTTGRGRRELARWMSDPENPLTARVMVNRIWKQHFGEGIVPTVDDFGRTGRPPAHPDLLDFLAREFIDSGWSIKRMHRLIMTSEAYRRSSLERSPEGEREDSANEGWWRGNLRRLESEAIRDSILWISGNLNRKQGGPPAFPRLPKEVHSTQDSAGKGWAESSADEQSRRSVYLSVKRALRVPFLECLDLAPSSFASGTRPVTTTAPQALTLLNDEFIAGQGRVFAARLAREAGESPVARVRLAFRLCLQREPSQGETERALKLVAAQSGIVGGGGDDKPGWQSFCRAMFNLNEVIYLD